MATCCHSEEGDEKPCSRECRKSKTNNMHIFRDFESWLINSRHIRTRLCPQCCFSVLRQMQNVSPLCASLLFHHNSLLFMENIIFHECSSTSLRLSPKRTTTCHSCTPLKSGTLVDISLKAVVNSGQ